METYHWTGQDYRFNWSQGRKRTKTTRVHRFNCTNLSRRRVFAVVIKRTRKSASNQSANYAEMLISTIRLVDSMWRFVSKLTFSNWLFQTHDHENIEPSLTKIFIVSLICCEYSKLVCVAVFRVFSDNRFFYTTAQTTYVVSQNGGGQVCPPSPDLYL